MQYYRLDASGTIDGIQLAERPTPRPRRGEILVRMRAASLNYLDLMILEGRAPVPSRDGLVPLSDGAGEVVEVGEDVHRVKVGDRIANMMFPRWISGLVPHDGRSVQVGGNTNGVLTQYAVFDQEAVVTVPDHLSYEEAATLPCAALTAWVALVGPRRILPGEVLLTQGTGGVSLFALQFAKLAGARVIATTSSEPKADRLRALGADAVINYTTTPDWGVAAKKLTGGRGVDHIIEIGGAGSLERSISSSGMDAQINLVGVLEKTAGLEPGILMRGVANIQRITVGSRTSFEAMNRAIAFHGLKPVIDRVFPFEEARDAFRHFHGRNHVGKVVISIG